MKSIFDRTFHYVPSVQTDIRKTFARIRREQERSRAEQEQAKAGNVEQIQKRRTGT